MVMMANGLYGYILRVHYVTPHPVFTTRNHRNTEENANDDLIVEQVGTIVVVQT